MSTKKRKMTTSRQRKTGLSPVWLIISLGVLVLAGAAILAATGALSGGSTGGSPHLVVDQDKIDFGQVKLGKTVTATFRITNTGTAPLKITEAPYIELKEGC